MITVLSGSRESGIRVNRALGIAVVAALWSYCVLPTIGRFRAIGRSDVYNGVEQIPYNPGDSIRLVTFAVLVLICIGAALAGRRGRLADSGLTFAFPVLASLFALDLIARLLSGGTAPLGALVVLPATAIAIWSLDDARFLAMCAGWAVVFTAVVAITAGLYSRWGLMTGQTYLEDKGIVTSSVLGGPFTHSNTLGLALAFGFPLVLMAVLRHRWYVQTMAYAAIVIAIVWSSSRAGLLTLSVSAILLLLLAAFPGRRASILTFSSGLGLLVLLAVPLASAPTAYTGRGYVWRATFESWAKQPLLGLGPDAFQSGSEVVSKIGYASSYGHNMLVTILGQYGVIGAFLYLGALVGLVSVCTNKQLPVGLAIIAPTLLAGGVLEGRAVFGAATDISFFVWLPVILTLSAYDRVNLNTPNSTAWTTRCG